MFGRECRQREASEGCWLSICDRRKNKEREEVRHFVAYKVYKELERIIALTGINLSVDRVLDIAKTITTIRVNMPQNHEIYTKTLFLSEEQNTIKPLFDLATIGVE